MNETQILIRKFKLNKYDFMGYHLNKNQATYHHIVKKENGGEKSIENGAVLMPVSHEYLHLLEYKDEEKYIMINNIFKIMHIRGYISKEDYVLIGWILSYFEEEHRRERRSNGKILIKNEFLRRNFK